MRSTFMPKVASDVTPRFLPLHRVIWPLLLVVLTLLAAYALARNIQKTYEPRGGIDLHPYWYYGHFVRAGINPYTAFAEGATLPEAVHYIDGSVVEADAVRQPAKLRGFHVPGVCETSSVETSRS